MPTIREIMAASQGANDTAPLGGPPPTVGGGIFSAPPTPGASMADPGMNALASVSDLPFGFRMRLQSARENPDAMAGVLKQAGLDLQLDQDTGRVVGVSPDGTRYNLDEFMPGPALLTKGPKVALMAALAANPGAGMARFAAGSALGSLAGSGYEQGLANLLGTQSGANLPRAAGDVAMNLATDTLFKGAGGILGAIAGKGRATSAYADALAESQVKQAAERATVAGQVQVAQAGLNSIIAGGAEQEAATIAKEQARSEYAKALGFPLDKLASVREADLAALTSRTQPVKQIIRDATQSIFGKVSAGYEQALSGVADNPVELADLSAAAMQARDFAKEAGHALSPSALKLLSRLEAMSGGSLPKAAKDTIEQMRAAGASPEALQAIASQVGRPAEAVTVRQLQGTLSDIRQAAQSGDPFERKIFANIGNAAQEQLQAAVPEDVAKQLKGLDAMWAEANKVVGGKFRQSVSNSSNPAEIADALLGTPKDRALHVERAFRVLAEVPAENLPAVRGAVIERIVSAPDPEKYVSTLDPSLLRKLLPGTGIENPKRFAELWSRQYQLDALTKSPDYMGRVAKAAEAAASSLRGKAAEGRLADVEAEAARRLGALRPPAEEAMQAASTAVKKPLRYTNWLGNHLAYTSGLALVGAGSFFHSGALYAAGPVLLGTTAFRQWMSDPVRAVAYTKMLMNPRAENVGNILGRIGAGALAEMSKATVRQLQARRELNRTPVTLRAPSEDSPEFP